MEDIRSYFVWPHRFCSAMVVCCNTVWYCLLIFDDGTFWKINIVIKTLGESGRQACVCVHAHTLTLTWTPDTHGAPVVVFSVLYKILLMSIAFTTFNAFGSVLYGETYIEGSTYNPYFLSWCFPISSYLVKLKRSVFSNASVVMMDRNWKSFLSWETYCKNAGWRSGKSWTVSSKLIAVSLQKGSCCILRQLYGNIKTWKYIWASRYRD